MNAVLQRRTWLFAGALGVLAFALGCALLWIGRAPDAAAPAYAPARVQSASLLSMQQFLSADAREGRAPGTAGNRAAQAEIEKRFAAYGLLPVGNSFRQDFAILQNFDETSGEPINATNIVGWLPGATPGRGPMLVVTAHFDHLGVVDGKIYNGADDNASGTAALVAIAEYMSKQLRLHDIVFAALDGEELGLLGARDLVRSGRIDLDRVALNLNFDMVSRSPTGELYAAGTSHTPELAVLVNKLSVDAPIKLLRGYDTPDNGPINDWTTQSDHAIFHEAGIPFLFFGVENHADYHQPTDDFERVTHDFFVRAADTLAHVTEQADRELVSIAALR
jgi:Peptidase family M28